MDDPTASCTSFSSIIYLLPPRLPFPLLVLVIGQFGHCTQELINLLLLGEAVSNVFDGDVPMDPTSADPNSLKLKGAHHQSEIGYLTQLESLRYCQVGSYLKIPIYPIWVIGSQSHFTVLFSLNRLAFPPSS
jgi:ubiquitin carboxyl-terminal hydrolase MINDY-3/4